MPLRAQSSGTLLPVQSRSQLQRQTRYSHERTRGQIIRSIPLQGVISTCRCNHMLWSYVATPGTMERRMQAFLTLRRSCWASSKCNPAMSKTEACSGLRLWAVTLRMAERRRVQARGSSYKLDTSHGSWRFVVRQTLLAAGSVKGDRACRWGPSDPKFAISVTSCQTFFPFRHGVSSEGRDADVASQQPPNPGLAMELPPLKDCVGTALQVNGVTKYPCVQCGEPDPTRPLCLIPCGTSPDGRQ
jgi:hypothetical protein